MLDPDFFFAPARGAMDILTPVTREAFQWVNEYLAADTPRIGQGYALEHSEALDVLDSVRASGLTIEDGNDIRTSAIGHDAED